MDETETPPLEQIRQMLERLKALDQQYWVFGARTHKYKSFPLSNDEIESLEVDLGVCLPADYRQFLLEIGYGAGPYYGLLRPYQILCDLERNHVRSYDPLPDPSRAFPFTREQADECFRIMSEGRMAVFTAKWPTDGCIPICFEGCSYYTFLITAGELTGSMWSHNIDWDDEDDPYLETWNLAPPPPGFRLDRIPGNEPALSPAPTFLEWYNAWLHQCLSDFEELWREVSRRHPKYKKRRPWSLQ